MKRLVEETNESAFDSLMGETITLFCLNYIYTGKLVGVNETCCVLQDPKIVYETGPFDDKKWKDAQSLPNELFVQYGCIEAFGVVK